MPTASPLALDGARQAARMALLAELRECRVDLRWSKGERRAAERSSYNRDILLTNIDLQIEYCRRDARDALAGLRAAG